MPPSAGRKNSTLVSTDTRDPYKVLELPVDCSAEDVRVAFRRLSKTMHPDTEEGRRRSAQEFKDILWAKDLLLDPKAREQFDRLGKVGGVELDIREKTLQVVNSIISQVLDAEDDEDTTPVLQKINAWLLTARTDLADQLRTARRKLKRARSIARRMTRKKGQGPDLLANIMRSRCDLAQKRVDAAQEAVEVHAKVIEFFADYEYHHDKLQQTFFQAGVPPRGINRSDFDYPPRD